MTMESLSLYNRRFKAENKLPVFTKRMVWLVIAAFMIIWSAPVTALAQSSYSPGGTGAIDTDLLTGDQLFDGVTYYVDVDPEAPGQTSDMLVIDGKLEFGSTLSTIDFTDWESGVFTIITATGGIFGNETDFNPVTVGGAALNNRQWAVVGLNAAGDTLRVHTKTLNLNLVWNGSVDSVWDIENTNNWYKYDTVDSEYFMDNDYVVFNTSGSPEAIMVDANVLVSGMSIDGGVYSFTGANITSVVPAKDNHQRVTNQLEVTGGANATFFNNLNFGGGMSISEDSTVIFDYDYVEDQQGAFIGGAVANQGRLYFSAGHNAILYHSSVISGSGDVWAAGSLTGSLSLSGDHTSTGTFRHVSGRMALAGTWSGNFVQSAGASQLTVDQATIKGSAALGYVYVQGALDIGGNLTLDDSLIIWNFEPSPTAPVVTVTGSVTLESPSYVSLNVRWTPSESKLMTAAQFINADYFDVVAGLKTGRLTSRVEYRNNNTELWLVNEARNLDVTWKGTQTYIWAVSSASINADNWQSAQNSSDTFEKWDYVIFDATGNDSTPIMLVNGTNLDFEVSGMLVSGGDYTFYGADLFYNTVTSLTSHSDTKKLQITGNGTSATFGMGLTFTDGIEIDGGATMVLRTGTVGGITYDGEIKSAVTNLGTLVFDMTGASTYSHGVAINGAGAVYKTGDGKLTLTADGSGSTFYHNGGELVFNAAWQKSAGSGGNFIQSAAAPKFTVSSAAAAIGGNAVLRNEITMDTNTSKLRVDGDLEIVDFTLNYNLGTQNRTGLIDVGGKVTLTDTVPSDGSNTIKITQWNNGTFTIISAAGGFVGAGNIAIDANPLPANGLPHHERRKLELVFNSDSIVLLASTDQFDLVWTGLTTTWDDTTSNVWNSAYPAIPAPEFYMDHDYVIFEDLGVDQTVNVSGTKVVSGMIVTGGKYTFSGAGINSTGDNINENSQTFTKKLEIKASADVTVANTLNFQEGAYIDAGGKVTVVDGGAFSSGMTVNNAGSLIFNAASDITSGASLSGNGVFTKTGLGTLNFSGNHTATSAFQHQQGVVYLQSGFNWAGNYNQTGGDLIVASTTATIGGDAFLRRLISVEGTGTLNITKNLTLTSAILNLNVETGSSYGRVVVGGTADIGGLAQLNFNRWVLNGTYNVIAATSFTNVPADLYNDITVTVAFRPLSDRYTYTIGVVSDAGTGKYLQLKTDVNLYDVVWTNGKGDNIWTPTRTWVDLNDAGVLTNWKRLSINNKDIYTDHDYVIFTAVGAGDINVVDLNNEGEVLVAGMEVLGGEYTFSGTNITTSTAGYENGQTFNRSLKISGSGTSATFYNKNLKFDGDITVENGAAAKFHEAVTAGGAVYIGAGSSLTQSGISTLSATSITNDGTIIFDRDGDTGRRYNQNIAIAGSGGVIKKDGTSLYLTQQNTATGQFVQEGGLVVFSDDAVWAGSYAQDVGDLLLNSGAYIRGDFFQARVADNFTTAANAGIGGNAVFQAVLDLNGTLNVGISGVGTGGNVTMNGARWLLSLGDDVTANDKIEALGNVTFGEIINTIDVDYWSDGVFTIISAANVADPAGNWSEITVNNMALGSRQNIVVSRSADNKQLLLSSTTQNLDLLWTGNTSGAWNTTTVDNWVTNDTFRNLEKYNPNDFVTFDATGGNQSGIILGGSGVQVSGMEVLGGNYTFTGASGSIIRGVAQTGNGQRVTGKLQVGDTTGAVTASAAFGNTTLNFVNGVDITALGSLTLNDGGAFAANMTVNNAGRLEFANTTAARYTNNAVIAGTGDVYKTGNGLLILASQNTSTGTFRHQNGTLTLSGRWAGDYNQSGGVFNGLAGTQIGGNVTQTAGYFEVGAGFAIVGDAAFGGRVVTNATFTTKTLALNSAILVMDVGTDANPNTPGHIAVQGGVTFTGVSGVDLSAWREGRYVLITSASGGISYTAGDLGALYIDGVLASGRQYYTVEVNSANTELAIVTASKMMNLLWTGTTGVWDTVVENNWRDADSPYLADVFHTNDYVIFDATGTTKTVAVTAGGVQVSGMEVQGGVYTFQGGDIKGVLVTGGGQTVTGQIKVSGGQAIVQNTLDFTNGMLIESAGTVTLGDGGSFSAMDITNQGVLEFYLTQGQSAIVDSLISGPGAVDMTGNGTVSMTVNNTATGTLNQSAGRLQAVYGWGGAVNQTGGTLVAGNAGQRATFAQNAALEGTLETGNAVTFSQNLHLDGALLSITVNRNGAVDLITVGGNVTYGSINRLNLRNWADGTYTLMTAGNIGTVAGNYDTGNLMINGMAQGDRQIITVSQSGQSLVVTGTTDNIDIIWNTGDATWSTAVTNDWVAALPPGAAANYNPNDYVIFNGTAGSQTAIQIGGDGVQVSGMEINGGEFTFTGGEIIGNTPVRDSINDTQTITGALDVNGGHGIFKDTTLDFISGVNVANGAALTMQDGAAFADGMAVDNAGTLTFDRSDNYDLTNVISGGGDLVKGGSGVLTVSGTNTATGTLRHNNGELNLTGVWAGDYTQASSAGAFTAQTGAAIGGDASFSGDMAIDGSLNVGGDMHLNGVSWDISLRGTPLTADSITVGGDVTFGSTANTLNVIGWTDGAYTIVTARSIEDIAGHFNNILVNGLSLGSRQQVGLEMVGTTQLQLVAATQNLDLEWTGANGGNWDTTTKNWVERGTTTVETYNADDYVVFTASATTFAVAVQGTMAQVSGMLVEGGNYVFTGADIVGAVPMVTGDQTVTGSLDITGGTATFYNGIKFENGINIAQNAGLIVGEGGSLKGSMAVNNQGLFVISEDTTDILSLGGEGGVTHFASVGQVLNIANSLSGSQTFDNVEVNMNTGVSDRIVVGGDLTGSHTVNMSAVGDVNKGVTGTTITVVSVGGSTVSGVISANTFEFGPFAYSLRTLDEQNWHVYRSGFSGSGQAIINTQAALNIAWFAQTDNLHKRMGDLRYNDYSVNDNLWVRAYGRQISGDAGISGVGKFRDNTYGVDFGADVRLGTTRDSAFYLGAFFGYANSSRSFKKAGSADGDSDSLYGGVYGTFVQKDGWYMDAVMKAQYFDNSFSAKSDKKDGFDSFAFGLSVEGGKTIQINEYFLEPSLTIAWAHTTNSNYTTKQGLRVSPDDADVFQAKAVVRAGGDFKLENGSVLQPYIKFGVEAQTSSGGDVRFAGERFRPDMDGVRGLVGAGLIWQLEDNVQLHFDYEGAFGSKYNQLFGISAGLRVTF